MHAMIWILIAASIAIIALALWGWLHGLLRQNAWLCTENEKLTAEVAMWRARADLQKEGKL